VVIATAIAQRYHPRLPMAARRVPELDGIRGLAILLVIYWHYVAAPNVLAPAGSLGWTLYRIGILSWSGVDLFFVLSGYLIGGILIESRDSPDYFKAFYVRRAFRILPLYLLFCGCGTAVVMLLPALGRVVGHPMPLWVYATFSQNFWLAHHSWDAYMGETWSLAVEEQFYLTLPFIIRLVPRSRLPGTVAGLVVASVIGRTLMYLHYGSEWGTAAYTLMPCRADALMLGALGALAVRDQRARRFMTECRWALPAAVALSGAAVAVLTAEGWTMSTRPMSTLGYTALAIFYLALLLWAVMRRGTWWAAVMRTRFLGGLGSLAYCLYLVHGSALNIASYLMHGRLRGSGPDWPAAAIGLACAVGFSAVSWRYLESRMIGIGHRLSRTGATAGTG
jgi:peptidoglycan/LPS O-acetylase OafA/YrhL